MVAGTGLFPNVGGYVLLGGVSCSVFSWTNTTIQCTMQGTPAGQHNLFVGVPGKGFAAYGNGFLVITSTLQVRSFCLCWSTSKGSTVVCRSLLREDDVSCLFPTLETLQKCCICSLTHSLSHSLALLPWLVQVSTIVTSGGGSFGGGAPIIVNGAGFGGLNTGTTLVTVCGRPCTVIVRTAVGRWDVATCCRGASLCVCVCVYHGCVCAVCCSLCCSLCCPGGQLFDGCVQCPSDRDACLSSRHSAVRHAGVHRRQVWDERSTGRVGGCFRRQCGVKLYVMACSSSRVFTSSAAHCCCCCC